MTEKSATEVSRHASLLSDMVLYTGYACCYIPATACQLIWLSTNVNAQNRKRKADDVDEKSQTSNEESKRPRNEEDTKPKDDTAIDPHERKADARGQADVKDTPETNGKRARSEEPDAKGVEPEAKRPRTDGSDVKTEDTEEKKENDKHLKARLDAMDAKDKENKDKYKDVPKPEVKKTNGTAIFAHPSGGWSNQQWVVPQSFDSKAQGWKFPDEIVEEPMNDGGGGRGRGRGRGDRGGRGERGDRGGRGGGRGGRGADRGGRGRGRPSWRGI